MKETPLPPFPVFNSYPYYNYYQQNPQAASSSSTYNGNSTSYTANNQQVQFSLLNDIKINQYSNNDDLILRVEKENTIGQLKLKARDYGIKPSGGNLDQTVYDEVGKNKHDLATAIVWAETSNTNPALIMSQMANSSTPSNNGVQTSQTASYGLSNGKKMPYVLTGNRILRRCFQL